MASWRARRLLETPETFGPTRISPPANQLVWRRDGPVCATRDCYGWKDGEHRDIARDMTRLTFEIVVKTLFNSDISNDADHIGEDPVDAGEAVRITGNAEVDSRQSPPGPVTEDISTQSARSIASFFASSPNVARVATKAICCRCCYRPRTTTARR